MLQLDKIIEITGEIRNPEKNKEAKVSVASENFGMALLAFLTTPPDLDKSKVISLALVHNLEKIKEISAISQALNAPHLVDLSIEYNSNQTPEAKFAHFLKQASHDFSPTSAYTQTNNYINVYGNDVKNVLSKINELKRSGWINRKVKKPESVAEHSYCVALMALAFAPAEMDKTKLVKMALVHDIQEIYAGDFTPHDQITAEEKGRLELIAAQKISKDLNNPEMLSLFMEYEKGEGKEAKFIKDLDRMDAVLLGKYYDDNKRAPKPLIPEFLPYAVKKYLGGYNDNTVKNIYTELKTKENGRMDNISKIINSLQGNDK